MSDSILALEVSLPFWFSFYFCHWNVKKVSSMNKRDNKQARHWGQWARCPQLRSCVISIHYPLSFLPWNEDYSLTTLYTRRVDSVYHLFCSFASHFSLLAPLLLPLDAQQVHLLRWCLLTCLCDRLSLTRTAHMIALLGLFTGAWTIDQRPYHKANRLHWPRQPLTAHNPSARGGDSLTVSLHPSQITFPLLIQGKRIHVIRLMGNPLSVARGSLASTPDL